MNILNKHIFGLNALDSIILGMSFIPKPNTTLNDRYNILQVEVEDNTPLTLSYLTIGNGFKDYIINNYNPSTMNTTLLNHIPFIITNIDNDISEEYKDIYRLRKVISINGNDYIAYYGLKLKNVNKDLSTIEISIDDNNQLIPKTINTNDIDQTKVDKYPINSYSSTDSIKKYALNIARFRVNLTPDIIENIYNAYTLLYPNEEPVINELGLCLGRDGIRTVDYLNNNLTYTEVDSCLLTYSVKKPFKLERNKNNIFDTISENIEIGGMEPFQI